MPVKKATKKTVKKKTKISEPKSMAELLAQAGPNSLRVFKKGDKVEGTITLINRKIILVDIGAKTEGVIPEKEVKLSYDFIKNLNVGDRIQAYVVREENEKGQLLLSIRRAIIEHKWQKMRQYFETGESFEVVGQELVKGGLLVKAMDLQGFIPASQFSARWAGHYYKLVDKKIKVKVIEVKQEINRLVLSEKLVTEAPLESEKKEILEKLDIKKVYSGVITGIVPFGAFVKVKAKEGKTKEEDLYLDGLIHISEIAWEKVDKIEDYIKVGQEIKVKIISVDKNSGKLQISIKRLTGDPWQDLEKEFPVNTIVKGKVKKIEAFGAFINIKPGVDALLHISKIPADVQLKENQEVQCYIESIDPVHRRLSVGLALAKTTVPYK